MRLPLILGLGLALAVSTSFAQQQSANRTMKPHGPARSEKTKKAAPLPRTTAGSAETAKELRRIEQQTAKTPLKANSAGQKHASGSAGLLKTKPAAASGSSGGMGTAKGNGTSQSKNPYRGRLRQKGSH
jgi:hypothetical protein